MKSWKLGNVKYIYRTNRLLALVGFFAGLLLVQIRFHEVFAPLAVGLLFGSQLMGLEPLSVVLGVVLGSVFQQPFAMETDALMLGYLLLYSILTLLQGRWKPSARFLLLLLVSLGSCFLSLRHGVEDFLYALVSEGLGIVVGFLYRKTFRILKTSRKLRPLSEVEQAVMALSLCTLVPAFSKVVFLNLSLAVTLLLLLSMVFVSLLGMRAVSVSALGALMLSIYTGEQGMLVSCLVLSTVLATLGKDRGRWFIVLSYLVSVSFFSLFPSNGLHTANAPNLLFACGLFALLPAAWMEELTRIVAFEQVRALHEGDAYERLQNHSREEILHTGKQLKRMSELLLPSPKESDWMEQWTARGALTVCVGCEVRRLCWKEPKKMQDALMELAEHLEHRASAAPIDPIDADCKHYSDLLAAVRLAYAQAKAQQAHDVHDGKKRDFLHRQFLEAGEAVERLTNCIPNLNKEDRSLEDALFVRLTEDGFPIRSASVQGGIISIETDNLRFITEERVKRSLEKEVPFRLRALERLERNDSLVLRYEPQKGFQTYVQVAELAIGEAENGDSFGECRLEGGKVLYAISDGMGSGHAARNESNSAIELLFDLYRMGMRRDQVLENVNRMLLKNGKEEMYATLDAVSIDLVRGECEVLKYGAPPCYLLRDGIVRSIMGEALPCGIWDDAVPSVTKMKLMDRDLLVLCTDGVQDALESHLESVLKGLEHKEGDMANTVLRAAKQHGCRDDMTVVVISVVA